MAYYPTKPDFPSPPPTTNALTSQQRSQLLRTTQKLGRLLGAAPALIEETDSMPSNLPLNLQRLAVPLHIQLSSVYDDGDALARYPSSGASESSHGSSSSSRRSSSQYPAKTTSVHVNDSWPKADRPFLRVAVNHSRSGPAPGSPPAYSPEPPHTSFTIRPSHRPMSAPPPPPASVMPSTNGMRRQKMDRLRRTLGDGVPVDLVFHEGRQGVPDSPQGVPRSRTSQPPRVSTERSRW
ncbi:hypothetical protein C8R43DRAFT_1229132 [Mycena crocata]|nr:hypothetical protein C8R43DRAFT_1229132 [Mycena crocata]